MTSDIATRVEAVLRQAVALHQQARLNEAGALYEQALQWQPGHFHALHMLGVVALQMDQPERAATLFGQAIDIDPNNVAALVNHGTAQHQLRRFDVALGSFDRAIALQPDSAEAYFNRGNALRDMRDFDAAIASYDAALSLKPAYVDAWLNLGLALSSLGRPHDAIVSYDHAIAARPDLADAHYNRANELHRLRCHDAAVASFNAAIRLQPNFADAHLNRGSALVQAHDYKGALASFEQAIALRPDHAESHRNRGVALHHLRQFAGAVASYDAAIALSPDHAESHANRGHALRELHQHEAALASYDRAIGIAGGRTDLLAVRRHQKMQVCDWRGLEADVAGVAASIESAAVALNPFYLLPLLDSARLQRRASEAWVQQECPPNASLGPIPARAPGPRIHIGYFSADFHEHATSYLIGELLELHDRSRFRITALSFGPDSQGPVRQRLQSACDDFLHVRTISDAEVAMKARALSIDIAVDLKGFTQDNRAGIFALRAAPLQINYLGYPGTMGAPYIDYLVADSTLVPAGNRQFYAEKIIGLPHSYQVNDSRRAIADRHFTRAELGLPPAGFIFCCFSNSYKILPVMLDRWMRILIRVPGSVLWLLEDNPVATANLRREAVTRGVSPERLVFARRIDLALHLARHRAADLFLDTLPCNAHTTASDALWTGVPVITCPGESFAGRVATSLVSAVGMPELAASTLDEYERLAVHLATDPCALTGIRERLAANRLTAPLFDTRRYTRYLERAYVRIHDRHLAGLSPEHVAIDAD
jgi:protein O-GlcNAc transferase